MNFSLSLSIAIAVLLAIRHYVGRKEYATNRRGYVVVTGASTGIGRDAAVMLATKNSEFIVYAGVRKEADFSTVKSMNISNLRPLMIDVSSHVSCVQAISHLKQEILLSNLPFVALVNNAGISRRLPAEYHSLDDAKMLFDTNFFGAVDLVQLTLPLLRASKGRVVMLSSVAGFIAGPLWSIYSASKFALEAFSDSLRREVGEFGVSVSIIEPGFVRTPILHGMSDADDTPSQALLNGSEYLTHYGRFYSPVAKARVKFADELAESTSVTNTAIWDAIVSPYPQTRYKVANIEGIPASVVGFLAWLLPDRLSDIISQ